MCPRWIYKSICSCIIFSRPNLLHQSIYLLAIAMGLGASYMEGPYRNFVDNFSDWNAIHSLSIEERDIRLELHKVYKEYKAFKEKSTLIISNFKKFFLFMAIISFILCIFSEKILNASKHLTIASIICALYFLVAVILTHKVNKLYKPVVISMDNFEKQIIAN